MRVAYIINIYPRVSHSFIRREMLELERRGVEVLRIAVRGWDEDIVDGEDQLERTRTRYILQDGLIGLAPALLRTLIKHPLRVLKGIALAVRMANQGGNRHLTRLVYLAEACRVKEWVEQAKVAHLHAHFATNSAEVAMQASLLTGVPWSFTAHGTEAFDNPLSIGLREKIERCRFAVAVSSYGRAQLYRSTASQNWQKVHVVRCGLDEKFHNTLDETGPKTTGLVCVGRLSEEKGQLLLVEAARQLAARNVDFQILIAGDGELRAQIERLIERHKLSEKIKLLGWLTGQQVRQQITASRALVLPSLAEGLPVVIMEAMALGRPVISTHVGGIPELVRPGQDGWLVPPGDPEALANAMYSCLMSRPEELLKMGSGGRERVLKLHDVRREAEDLRGLFLDEHNSSYSRLSTQGQAI